MRQIYGPVGRQGAVDAKEVCQRKYHGVNAEAAPKLFSARITEESIDGSTAELAIGEAVVQAVRAHMCGNYSRAHGRFVFAEAQVRQSLRSQVGANGFVANERDSHGRQRVRSGVGLQGRDGPVRGKLGLRRYGRHLRRFD